MLSPGELTRRRQVRRAALARRRRLLTLVALVLAGVFAGSGFTLALLDSEPAGAGKTTAAIGIKHETTVAVLAQPAPVAAPIPTRTPTQTTATTSAKAVAKPTLSGGAARAAKPAIVEKPIPYGPKRRAEMAAYAERHYGLRTSRLQPRVIVQHYTASTTFESAFWTFAADVPDSELHELPGTCAHFIIDRAGTIYQLVPTTVMCRHTVGLNYTAIGIEHVGLSDREILRNPAQLTASLRLTVWLMQQHQVALGNVIGHNENRTSAYHKELYAAWRCQTHGDWSKADMDLYRARLRALAKASRVPLGAAVRRVRPSC